MSEPRQLISELMRPQQLHNLTLPRGTIERLERMIEASSIQNLLFYGQPGSGKTSAACILIKAIGPQTSKELNGSSANGVGFVRDEIERYALSLSLFDGVKICFIDEADYLPKKAQAALLKVVERASCNCRFLFAANNPAKLLAAIRSRLMPICFDIAPAHRLEVQQKLVERYECKLSELGISFNKQRMKELVGIYYPDLRSIANHIEFEFA